MTTAEAIEFIRVTLDESGTEYYTSDDIRSALKEAQTSLARRWWQSGNKEAIRPLVRTESFGAATGVLSEPMLQIESVMLRAGVAGSFKLKAVYVPPHEYDMQFDSAATSISGRYEYTVEEGTVKTNGSAFMATYYRVPALTSELALPVFTHAIICDDAAALLYRKDHPGAERPTLGSIYDIEELLRKKDAA